MAHALRIDALFEEHRTLLWGLCYRMTGSAADADDLVQDTFLRAMERPPRRLDEPLRPWLVKVALNLSRDLLRRRKRREYTGPWLPSPIDTTNDQRDTRGEPPAHDPDTLEGRYELLESVSFAFLVALEALTPTQRAVLLLRDVFDYSVHETAQALDLTDANVKTTHYRARQAMETYHAERQVPTAARQEATATALRQFLRALEHHDVGAVESLLADGVRLTTDGGGEFRAALKTIVGRDKVLRFYVGTADKAATAKVHVALLNGLPSLIFDIASPPPGLSPRFTLSAQLNADGKIAHLYLVSATPKLTALPEHLGDR
jgi:RNA polymerase sigma-70 factor (ECF subfamily)